MMMYDPSCGACGHTLQTLGGLKIIMVMDIHKMGTFFKYPVFQENSNNHNKNVFEDVGPVQIKKRYMHIQQVGPNIFCEKLV